jgi:hypothetical protein
MKVVKVKWLDSGMHISDGWQPLLDAMGNFQMTDLHVTTVGILADENDEVLIVGLSQNEPNGHWFGLQIIVKQNVLEYEVLAE